MLSPEALISPSTFVSILDKLNPNQITSLTMTATAINPWNLRHLVSFFRRVPNSLTLQHLHLAEGTMPIQPFEDVLDHLAAALATAPLSSLNFSLRTEPKLDSFLSRPWPNLKTLTLSHGDNLPLVNISPTTASAVTHLTLKSPFSISKFPSLLHLDLGHDFDYPLSTLTAPAKHHLKSLTLQHSDLTQQTHQHLTTLPNLTTLHIRPLSLPKLEIKTLLHTLHTHQNLKRLHLTKIVEFNGEDFLQLLLDGSDVIRRLEHLTLEVSYTTDSVFNSKLRDLSVDAGEAVTEWEERSARVLSRAVADGCKVVVKGVLGAQIYLTRARIQENLPVL
ncbi:hypothetical protein HDV00_008624 [Rhizophlyctis rosea]|nr:hypothetical protein HDV00_008624 [Rhizophlyctis rosea]